MSESQTLQKTKTVIDFAKSAKIRFVYLNKVLIVNVSEDCDILPDSQEARYRIEAEVRVYNSYLGWGSLHTFVGESQNDLSDYLTSDFAKFLECDPDMSRDKDSIIDMIMYIFGR